MNVKGLNHPITGRKILFINSKKVDIALVQETHMIPTESEKLCRGVEILIHRHLQFMKEAGRVLPLLEEIQGQTVIPVNVYALNIDDPLIFILL